MNRAARTHTNELIAQLEHYRGFTDEAISIAEGWLMLPEPLQRHVRQLIDQHMSAISPAMGCVFKEREPE